MIDRTGVARVCGLRAFLCGVAAMALLAGPAQAAETYDLDLPPAPLDQTLVRLGKQTHQQVFFRKSLVAGRTAPALRGRYTVEDALAALLGATDLSASRAGPHLLVLQRTPPAPASRQPVREADDGRPFAVATARPDEPPTASVAADPQTPGVPAEPTELEAVEVTGSHIRGAPVAAPLLSLDREDLERTGQVTIADALRALPQNFGGGASEATVNTGGDRLARNATFGSALNLRGLGNNATLVLINGRRMAGSGTFGDFVDVSTIPTGAVQRVEVLLDGASAIYGSDAVGGVVNIITRQNFSGAETRLLGGVGTAGEPAQAQISQTFGRRWSNGSVFFAYELQRRDNLNGDDRDFTRSADLRPLGGSDQRLTFGYPGNVLVTDPVTRALVPGFAIPAGQNGVGLRPTDFLPGVVNRGNQREGQDTLPKQTLNSVYLSADQELGARLRVTGDARFSARRFKSHQFPALSTFTVTRANPFYVSPTGATSQTISYSFAEELPNSTVAGTSETLAATLGAELQLRGDWRAESYVAVAQSLEEARTAGIINSIRLNEALGSIADRPDTAFSPARDGFFNPFTGIPGGNNGAVLAHIASGFSINRARSRTYSATLQADGPLWSLPGGALKAALGVQARRETLLRSGANFTSTATPTPISPTDAGRDVTAAFAELRAPIVGPDNSRPGLQRLELSLAGRVEHYETFGTTTNPKVGLVWAPVQDLNLRLTYGRSFRAPALSETNDAPAYSPTMLALSTSRILSLNLAGGNPRLKPETANAWTAGFDFKPSRWPGLAIAVTAFDVKFRNRIDRPVSANLANALTDPTLTSFVTRISPASNPADRALIAGLLATPFVNTANGVFAPEAFGAIVDNRYVNTTALHVRGVDVTGGYTFDVGDDRVALGASASYMIDYDQQITPTSPGFDRVNLVGFPVRFRSRLTADWTRGRATLGGAFNYTGAYRDTLGARIASQRTFDLQARLAPATSGSLRDLGVLINVRNVFDRDPPFYNNSVGVGYDPAQGDPIGRYVSIQLTRAW